MADKLTRAKLKQDYKRKAVILMGGLDFNKDTWTDIPANQVEAARKNHSDILDFEEVEMGTEVPKEVDHTKEEQPVEAHSSLAEEEASQTAPELDLKEEWQMEEPVLEEEGAEEEETGKKKSSRSKRTRK